MTFSERRHQDTSRATQSVIGGPRGASEKPSTSGGRGEGACLIATSSAGFQVHAVTQHLGTPRHVTLQTRGTPRQAKLGQRPR